MPRLRSTPPTVERRRSPLVQGHVRKRRSGSSSSTSAATCHRPQPPEQQRRLRNEEGCGALLHEFNRFIERGGDPSPKQIVPVDWLTRWLTRAVRGIRAQGSRTVSEDKALLSCRTRECWPCLQNRGEGSYAGSIPICLRVEKSGEKVELRPDTGTTGQLPDSSTSPHSSVATRLDSSANTSPS